MKHPVEADLALFAGHDLSLISEWRIRRHVSRCEECQATVESFQTLQAETSGLGELPANLAWNRLASEMKANIRLGLAAGQCVAGASGSYRPKRSFTGFQTLLAYASVIALVVAGLWLQRPAPPAQSATDVPEVGSVLAATRDGVELSEPKGSFGLRYGASRDVNYSAGAKGVMRARYVDASTGYVTVVSVNVE